MPDSKNIVINNGCIVNPANPGEVAAAITNAFAGSGAMCQACITSMQPYDESLINPEIVKLILDCNHGLSHVKVLKDPPLLNQSGKKVKFI